MRHVHRPTSPSSIGGTDTSEDGAISAVDPDVHAVDRALDLLSSLEPSTVLSLAVRPGARDVVAVRPLPADPRCGGAGLFAMRAPDRTTVVGASFLGRTSSTDAAPDRRVDVVVGRNGTVASRVHRDDGTVVPTPGPAGGVVVDALHRMLGLATPGDTPPLHRLVVAIWLHEVLGLCDHGGTPDWDAAVAVHPQPPGTGTVPPSEEAAAAAILAVSHEASWDGLHRAASSGRMSAPELSPTEAAWMDVTFFARWVLESFLPPESALQALRERGAGHLAEQIGRVLDRLATQAD